MPDQHPEYPQLFWSMSLGNLIIKNRAGLAPMTRTSAEENGVPSAQMVQYYSRYAEGGFGLLITEGTYPDEAYSQGYLNQPGIANRQHIEGWKKVISKVHGAGARIFCQLMHAGALSQGNIYKQENIAPSAIQPKGEQLGFYGGEGQYPVPEEMSREDIQQVINGFANAALNARDAGFDGAEIHGANGYLLDQFLTDYTNQRTDEYGGSTENRVRLLIEVCQAVREAVGDDFPVGIRISQAKVNDYTHKWAGGEEDARIIFSSLGKAGLDFLHVTEYQVGEAAFAAGGPSLASLAKKWGRLPVFANGSITTGEQAEKLLEKEEVDLVCIGKAALANKDWPLKVARGEALEPFKPEAFFNPNAKLKEFEL
ncbi:oxidoreductase [Nafulsella turpanensis]|uniref:oxidoreductase n=1 Tax=Nafulsella turpanensis TaxID=1265690 RepID=UPI0012693ACB|nr:NADH:flavin oxidoreductase [Nafulsella turpanensis]